MYYSIQKYTLLEDRDDFLICEEDRHENCYMREQCQKYDTCPMALVQKLLSGKWKILMLWFMSSRTLRFSDIQKKLPNVTQKMITQQLRSLEKDKLVFRHVYLVVPPKVEYGLTPRGRRIIPILEQMHSFGVEYLKFSEPQNISQDGENEVME